MQFYLINNLISIYLSSFFESSEGQLKYLEIQDQLKGQNLLYKTLFKFQLFQLDNQIQFQKSVKNHKNIYSRAQYHLQKEVKLFAREGSKSERRNQSAKNKIKYSTKIFFRRNNCNVKNENAENTLTPKTLNPKQGFYSIRFQWQLRY